MTGARVFWALFAILDQLHGVIGDLLNRAWWRRWDRCRDHHMRGRR